MKSLVIVYTILFVASYHCKVKAGRLSDVQSPRNRSEDVDDTVYLKDRLRLLETRLDVLETSCARRTPNDNLDKLPSNLLRARRANEGFVGFTAYIDHLIEHLGIDQPIVFDKVLLNEGGAYNPISGHFTCPVEGFYAFSYYIYINNLQETGDRQLVARLSVDGVNQLDGIADTYHKFHESQGGNFDVLHLRAGQIVYIQNYRWPDENIDGRSADRMSSFSGFLIS